MYTEKVIIPATYSEISYLFFSNDLPNGAMVSWGVRNADSMSPSEIAEGAIGVYNANIKPICPVRVQLQSVRVKNGPNDVGPDATLAVGSVGTGPTGTVLANSAVLARKRTNTGGRKGRGRSYFPFVTEETLGDGMLLSTTYVDDAADKLNSWLDGMESLALFPVLLHGSVGDEPHNVTSVGVDSLPATQRRRLRA